MEVIALLDQISVQDPLRDVRFVSIDRYENGSSFLNQNVITEPKHDAGPTSHEVQSLEALSNVS